MKLSKISEFKLEFWLNYQRHKKMLHKNLAGNEIIYKIVLILFIVSLIVYSEFQFKVLSIKKNKKT